jgi:hypothetical protein
MAKVTWQLPNYKTVKLVSKRKQLRYSELRWTIIQIRTYFRAHFWKTFFEIPALLHHCPAKMKSLHSNILLFIHSGADKSLARPGRKQTTATKLARRLACFVSTSVTRKDSQFGTWPDPSFKRHYRFRPRIWVVGWAKDLSAPRINTNPHTHRPYTFIHTLIQTLRWNRQPHFRYLFIALFLVNSHISTRT